MLDLFSCAGGAAMGYQRPGFNIEGVDFKPQPRYPFKHHVADALTFLRQHGHEYDAIHASCPCQLFTAYRRRGAGVGDGYLNLIPATRELLKLTGRPWVIENVEAARSELRSPVMLCGSSFGLDVRRHRLFEANTPLLVPPCAHSWQTPRFPPASNRVNLRKTVEVGVRRIPLDVQRKAMGIEWMTREELSQAIPPAYTELIGRQLLEHIEGVRAA